MGRYLEAPYTVRGRLRQPVRLAALVAALVLAGCSSLHLPMPQAEITGSTTIAEPALSFGSSAHGDWDVVRRTVETSVAAQPGSRVAWLNHETGNSGTITDLAATQAKNGAPCRSFVTTMTTLDGVRQYRGEACKGFMGGWELVSVKPADSGGANG